MDDESLELFNDQSHLQNPSRGKVCCLMCSCRNKKGFWYTKLGKFIFWFPIFIILFGIGMVLLDLIGIATMKVIYDRYDVSTGCLYREDNNNCTDKPMCYINDHKALIIGCAAIGSISFVVLFISILLIMVFIGLMFYCTDSCCSEIDKSYKYSKFTLQRRNRRERDETDNF